MIEILVIFLAVYAVAMQRRLSSRITNLEQQVASLRGQAPVRVVEQPLPPAMEVGWAADTLQETAEPGSHAVAAARSAHGMEPSAEHVAEESGVAAAMSAGQDAIPAISKPSVPPRQRASFESTLGARWPVWVGGVALALGGIFLVRYSIEAGLLGPGVRLALAALFGLILVAAGEIIRRRFPETDGKGLVAAIPSGLLPGIPGVLTAAGAVALLGATYAAYAVYGFFGTGTAFALMAAVSLATIALSLLHGQALAGLGLLASLLTPALVNGDTNNVDGLFLFLGIVWLAVNGASRLRHWTVVPMLANIGAGIWASVYAVWEYGFDAVPSTALLLVMIAGTVFLWPGRGYEDGLPTDRKWHLLLSRPPRTISLSLSLAVMIAALATLSGTAIDGLDPLFAFAAVIAALAAYGASRRHAPWAAIISAAGALLGLGITAINWLDMTWIDADIGLSLDDTATSGKVIEHAMSTPLIGSAHDVPTYLLLGAIFTLCGAFFLKRFRRQEPLFSALWAVLMGGMPVALGFIGFLNFGVLTRDWTFGLYGAAIGLVLLACARWQFAATAEDEAERIDWPANLLVAGAFAGLTLAIHALTNGLPTTVLMAVLGFAFLLAGRARDLQSWPAMPWMMAAGLLVVFGHIAWEPTLVGRHSLGTTPFFNALLPGYGIPALLAISAAWLMRATPDVRLRNVLQGLAALLALMTVAVLARHAMNGGHLDGNTPSLGEQSIYTLITIGFSGILMTLDLRSPSSVFRWGSMIAGAVATIDVLGLHVVALNPYVTGEGTGSLPFFNLLMLGYLLPGIAYGAVAYLARGRRPMPYIAMLSAAGALMLFLWVTLSVRRFWQGEYISAWQTTLPGETYTYSVVWLAMGVVLLVLGSRFDVKSLRVASAALVLIAVVKVFVIDMANLEGILRALSFIGLGVVLIGIGLFYQRILMKKSGSKTSDSITDPEGPAA